MIAPLPDNEADRLRALAEYDVLGLQPEPALDRLTALTARMFRVPIVLISLVGKERQWLKSHHGLNVCETSRDVSFCSHAILVPREVKVFVVPDATLDTRFADNALVTGEPYIRFYAGAPLLTAGGYAIGSLCLIDTVPRTLPTESEADLSDLAAAVMATLELRLVTIRQQEEAAERHRAETALRRSEKHFRHMAANTPGMVYQFVMEPDGKSYFPFVSEGCREFYGVDPQGLYDRPEIAFETLEASVQESFAESIALSAKNLSRWEWEGSYRAPDGTTRWAHGTSRPERLADGRTLWNGMLFDITARKDAEQAAERGARRIQTVLESITDAFFSVDHDWRFTYVNDQALHFMRKTRADLLGHNHWEVFPQVIGTELEGHYRRAMATNEPVSFETELLPRAVWYDIHAYPSEEGLSVYFQDITARKHAQLALEDSHSLLRAIIDGTNDAVFIKDRESRYLLMNPASAAMLGTTPEQAVGKTDDDFFPFESARQSQLFDREIMSTGQARTYESTDVIAGVEHTFLSTKSPHRDAAGNLLGVIGIAREVTEQRRAAEALKDAKEQAERANNAKSEFLSRMSHELRTPLNAILGFGQLLELGEMDEQEFESVSHILKAGRHLLHLINEVLAISRIEAGRINLSLEPVAVAEMVQECLSLVSRQAADRGIHCEDRCSADNADCGRYVLADRQRLRQVLLNLLSNAVKYNREGGRVTLACRECVCGKEQAPALRLEVIDTGEGLTDAQINRLFRPFERLDAERTTTEGTGLGLAVSKGLVEAMKGQIGVDSTPGEGSTFWVELPLAVNPLAGMGPDTVVLPKLPSEECLGTVLYIEDNLSNLRLIELLVASRPGLQLLSAQQGTLGLEIARARRPDLILLDLHLPDLPGWEVLAELQADETTGDIPVVIISADATRYQIERLMQAGAREYLTKPIDVPTLMNVLQEYLSPCFPSATDATVGTGRG